MAKVVITDMMFNYMLKRLRQQEIFGVNTDGFTVQDILPAPYDAYGIVIHHKNARYVGAIRDREGKDSYHDWGECVATADSFFAFDLRIQLNNKFMNEMELRDLYKQMWDKTIDVFNNIPLCA